MPQPSTRRMERRISTRVDAQLSMRLGGSDQTAPEIVTETQNISSSGVYCTSPHYLAPLSRVDLTLVLPEAIRARMRERLLKCEAVVVRCQATSDDTRRRYQLACSFLGLGDEHRRLLDDFVTLRNLKALHGAVIAARPPRRARPKPASKVARAPGRRATAAGGSTRKPATAKRVATASRARSKAAARPLAKATTARKRVTPRPAAKRRRG